MHATRVAVGGPGFCLPACIGRSESVRRESRRAVGRGTFPRGIAWYWAVHPDRPLTRSHHMATKKAAKKKPAAKKAVKKSAAKKPAAKKVAKKAAAKKTVRKSAAKKAEKKPDEKKAANKTAKKTDKKAAKKTVTKSEATKAAR